MKKTVFLAGCLLLAAVSGQAQTAALVIADFNSGEARNNFGKPVEVWLKDNGGDATQSCAISWVKEDALGDAAGQALRLDYDVDSPNPAYNGLRMELSGISGTYSNLVLYIKGDAAKGFSQKVKIELIQSGKGPSPYIIDGITGEWQKVTVPLSDFWLVDDVTKLEKFVVVFADIVNEPKSGTIYMDQVGLE